MSAYRWYASGPFSWLRHLLMVLLGVFAMMSKPMLVTLPCVLLLLDVWPLGRLRTVSKKRLLLEKAPLFAMAAITAACTLSMNRSANDMMWSSLPWYYCAGNAVRSLAVYLKQMSWPSGLTCFYPFLGRDLASGDVMLAAVVLALVSALVWWRRRSTVLVVGWLWYVGMLMPVIGLFTQAGDQAHADRYTYLSMIGITLMVAWSAVEWADGNRVRRTMLAGMALAVVVLLTFAARVQVSYWRNTLALWSHAVECYPDNGAAYSNLGVAQADAGRLDDAIASYRRALTLSPPHFLYQSCLNLGGALLKGGKLDDAELYLRRAVGANERGAEAQGGLATLLMHKGELRGALEHYQKAVDIRPDADACYNLGRAQYQAGQMTSAMNNFMRALAVDPRRMDLYVVIGMAYASQKNQMAAADFYRRGLSVDPNHLACLNNLAWLLATSRDDSLRDGEKAVQLMEHALRLPDGSKPHLLHTLAAAYAETGRYEKAVATIDQAIDEAAAQNNSVLIPQLKAERLAYMGREPWRE